MTLEGIIPSEIAEEPDAIRATVQGAADSAIDIALKIRAIEPKRIFLIGNGTSYHSCLAASAAHFAASAEGDPATIPMTAGHFMAYPPSLSPSDVVIGISASGEFSDVVDAIARSRGIVVTIGITHVRGSTLTRVADEVILSAGGPSRVPVMTKTFVSTLAATQLLLANVRGSEQGNSFSRSALRAADQSAEAITGAARAVEGIVKRIGDKDHLFVVGAGAGAIAAEEAALKLKEIALVHAEATEAWEMTSGAATMISEDSVVIALALPGAGRAAVTQVAGHAAGWGAQVIEVATERTIVGADLLTVPVDSREEDSSYVAVAPVALLAFALALQRGATPDRPDWVNRYRSQGLNHLVGADLPR